MTGTQTIEDLDLCPECGSPDFTPLTDTCPDCGYCEREGFDADEASVNRYAPAPIPATYVATVTPADPGECPEDGCHAVETFDAEWQGREYTVTRFDCGHTVERAS